MTPKLLLKTVSIAEACTWTILLVGMLVKYAFDGTGLIVSIGGSLHGAAFLAYLFCGLIVGVNQRFTWLQLVVGGLAAIPPFATLFFDWWAQRAGLLEGPWRRAHPGAIAPVPAATSASATSSAVDAVGRHSSTLPAAATGGDSATVGAQDARGTATATVASARPAHPADARVAERGRRPAKLAWLDGFVRWCVAHPYTLVCVLVMVFALILTGSLSGSLEAPYATP